MSKLINGPVQTEQTMRHALTAQQRVFMRSLQDAISEHDGPVCVDDIREHLGKSDSRVRSHISDLVQAGYVCCVGRSRVKMYVPSMLWFDEPEADLELSRLERISIGGTCESHGCDNLAEDSWRGNYLCRRCIMGFDDEEEMMAIRKRWEGGISPGSPGRMLEEALGEPRKK